MPRRGTKRGMRNRGGLAKRLKVNNSSIDNTINTVICSAVEMVVSTVNDNLETCPVAEVVSTANDNMVTWPDEEIFTTVNDISETCPVVEIVSTTNNVETCPVEEVVSTTNNNMITCPVEEIVSTLNEEANNVIDLTQDESEAYPVSSDVPLNSVSNNPVANLNLDKKINPVSSTSIPDMSCSTSVNDASSALVGTSKPKNLKSGSVTHTEDECPVCLHPCVHPSKLPCSHVFCYLCIKGIARIGQPCPMCRSPIPHYYANRPQLVSPNKPSPNDSEEEEEDQEKYCWFYQGRNGGWWQFEERMSDEIEENHSLGVSSFEMMICGSLYVIDTAGCVQYPKNCPMRRRRLLRDLPSHINRIGVAGIHSVPARTK